MTILVSQTRRCWKAQIRTCVQTGFKPVYHATSTQSEEAAARAVVRRWFSERHADTVREVRDPDEIRSLIGSFNDNPRRRQLFGVWTFNHR